MHMLTCFFVFLGFFSVQVMERALNVWGLRYNYQIYFEERPAQYVYNTQSTPLAKRSNASIPRNTLVCLIPSLTYIKISNSVCSTQLGFILNQNQHWFTLRRFGPAEPDMNKDPGLGHWYNLDSTHRGPEWISRTYLGMFIQQAEQDGSYLGWICFSVF